MRLRKAHNMKREMQSGCGKGLQDSGVRVNLLVVISAGGN